MNVEKLFRLADEAKDAYNYRFANKVFAVLAFEAIMAQKYGKPSAGDDIHRIRFFYETDADDVIEAMCSPYGTGYYDLPALSFSGEGGNYYLCIPLPLVSRWFLIHMLWLRPHIISRGSHDRRHLFLSDEERERVYCELERQFAEEVTADVLHAAVRSVLRSE
jgi:hypothetical protein